MSTCHQAHNIPWNTFLEQLHKVPVSPKPHENVEGDSYELVFTPDKEETVCKRMKFFAAKIESTIKEFSKTERAKYIDQKIDNISELYGKESCNEWLKEGPLQKQSGWESESGNKLDALKELFIQEKVSSLLHLARKGFPIETFQFVTYSNFFHYGLGRIKEDCLTLYLHLNLLLASGTLKDPEKWYAQWRRFLQREILQSYDGNCMHSHMYKDYFEKNPNFEDLEELQNLLKRLFRMLYIYDMVFEERGKGISWQDQVLKCIWDFLDRTKGNRDLWYQQTCKTEHDKK